MNYYLDIKSLLNCGDPILINETLAYYNKFLEEVRDVTSPTYFTLFHTLKSTGFLLEIKPEQKSEIIHG
jgi:hypothetical protein